MERTGDEPDTASQPENVVVTQFPIPQLPAGCNPVSFAEHDRFWTPAHGTTEVVDAGSSREPSFAFDP